MMLRKNIRLVIAGILITFGGAYLWGLIVFSGYAIQENWFGFGVMILSAYAVLIMSWFLLPMGIIVGSILPCLIRSKTSFRAAAGGAALGISCGVTAAIITGIVENWAYISGAGQIVNHDAWWNHTVQRFTIHAISMAAVAGAVVGISSVLLKRSLEPGEVVNSE